MQQAQQQWEGESPVPELGEAEPVSGAADVTAYWASGSTTVFIRVGEWGLRFYRTRESRDQSHDVQTRLAELSLAPRTGPKLNLAGAFGGHQWAYVTQVADQGEARGGSGRHRFYQTPHTADDRAELQRKLQEAGAQYIELSPANVGHIDGRLVLIDFSDVALADLNE
jgi:hypothetical protein